jgi:hypothetical protein
LRPTAIVVKTRIVTAERTVGNVLMIGTFPGRPSR